MFTLVLSCYNLNLWLMGFFSQPILRGDGDLLGFKKRKRDRP